MFVRNIEKDAGWDLTKLMSKFLFDENGINLIPAILNPGNFYLVEFSSIKSEDVPKLGCNFGTKQFKWIGYKPVMFIEENKDYFKILFNTAVISIGKNNYCKFVPYERKK